MRVLVRRYPPSFLSILLIIILSSTSLFLQTSEAFSAPRPSRTSGGSSSNTRRQRNRRTAGRNTGTTSSSSSDSGPRGPKDGLQRRSSRRSRPSTSSVKFDPKSLTSVQSENMDAPSLSLFEVSSKDGEVKECGALRLRPTEQGVVQVTSDSIQVNKSSPASNDNDKINNDNDNKKKTNLQILQRRGRAIRNQSHYEQLGLDDLFPNTKYETTSFSKIFYTDSEFREDIRKAIRNDIFDTTPAYAGLSPKVKVMMLDDDSSLQGSWNCKRRLQEKSEGGNEVDGEREASSTPSSSEIRMNTLTEVFRNKLGSNAPTGDEFMMTLGGLCGRQPSTHWMDIIGVKDRPVTHSWHQDTGRSHSNGPGVASTAVSGDNGSSDDESCYTVMLGFPCEDEYNGTGVFSHVIKLSEEHWAPEGMYSGNEPVLFEGIVDEEYIVRPRFGLGKEILRYRDVDTVHSAPDVIYRSSIMRFM